MECSVEIEPSIEEDFDEKIKLMLLGDSSVGKSSILRKYCNNDNWNGFSNEKFKY